MATTDPILHPATEQSLKQLLSRPPHALLLTGPAGLGKATIATWLAAQLLDVSPDKLQDYPYMVHVKADTGTSIGIETIRELAHVLSLKIPGEKSVSRVVVIEDAGRLTVEAQNALLKTLEEPPLGTVLIMTAPQAMSLLPTIRSRTQTIELLTPSPAAVHDALQRDGVSPEDLKRIMALSGGLPGLAYAMAQGDETHPLVKAAQTARQLLQQSAFERLSTIETLAKDKQAAQNVASMLSQMAHAALLTGRAASRWQKVLAASYQAEADLLRGGQAKLVLSNLMLNL